MWAHETLDFSKTFGLGLCDTILNGFSNMLFDSATLIHETISLVGVILVSVSDFSELLGFEQSQTII